MRGHERRLVRILKDTLFFVYPRFLLGLENVSQIVCHPLPLIFGEGRDVALAQPPSDDTFGRCGQDIFQRNFFWDPEEFLV